MTVSIESVAMPYPPNIPVIHLRMLVDGRSPMYWMNQSAKRIPQQITGTYAGGLNRNIRITDAT